MPDNILDPVKNNVRVTVASGGFGSAATTLPLAAGEGAKLLDPATYGAYNLEVWNSTDYPNPTDDPDHEYVRITVAAGGTDNPTMQRPDAGNNYNGEGSENTAKNHNTPGKTYKAILTPSKKFRDDIEGMAVGMVVGEVPVETPNGVITNFSTLLVFAANSERVFKNGQRMKRGSGNDYTVDSDYQGITFTTAPQTGDVIVIDYQKTNGTFIKGSNSPIVGETPSGSVNGVNTSFALAGTPIANSEEVYQNGIRLTRTEDYTISGGTITFLVAPLTGDIIRVNYWSSAGSATHNAATLGGFSADLFFSVLNGGLFNGKIVPTVSSNALTLAIKTLAGVDPSASDPVKVVIDGTLRSITAALSLTIAQTTTSTFKAGSTEFVGKAIDYFACLIWDSTASVVRLGMTRWPGAKSYTSWTNIADTEKFMKLSGGTLVATDPVKIIGRFEATLSFSSPNYNWSVPTYTPENLVQGFIDETRWLDWTAVLSAAASTVPTYTATFQNKYRLKGDICEFDQVWNNASGGTAGSGTGRLYSSLPFSNANFVGDRSQVGHGYVFESTGDAGIVYLWQDTGPASPLVGASSIAYGFDTVGNHATANSQSSVSRYISTNGKYRT